MSNAYIVLADELIEENFKSILSYISCNHPKHDGEDLQALFKLWHASYEVMKSFHHKQGQFKEEFILEDLRKHFQCYLEKHNTYSTNYLASFDFSSWITTVCSMENIETPHGAKNYELLNTFTGAFPIPTQIEILRRVESMQKDWHLHKDYSSSLPRLKKTRPNLLTLKPICLNKIQRLLTRGQKKPRSLDWIEPILLSITVVSLIAAFYGAIGGSFLMAVVCLTGLHGAHMDELARSKSVLTKQAELARYNAYIGEEVSADMINLVATNITNTTPMMINTYQKKACIVSDSLPEAAPVAMQDETYADKYGQINSPGRHHAI